MISVSLPGSADVADAADAADAVAVQSRVAAVAASCVEAVLGRAVAVGQLAAVTGGPSSGASAHLDSSA